MRWILRSKTHHAPPTEANFSYIGSITIDENLIERFSLWIGERDVDRSSCSAARRRQRAPLPLRSPCGEGSGVGSPSRSLEIIPHRPETSEALLLITASPCLWTPTPDPFPQGGGERVSVAAMLRSNVHMTTFMESIVYSAQRGPKVGSGVTRHLRGS
jgi:aspartate decarboxylase